MIRCSGCDKRIWRNDIEGWCHDCKKMYHILAENYGKVHNYIIGIDEAIGNDFTCVYQPPKSED